MNAHAESLHPNLFVFNAAVPPCKINLVKQALARFLRDFREVSAKFSRDFRNFRTFFEVFGLALTCPGLFGCVRMRSDASGCVRMHSDAFGNFGRKIKFFCNFVSFLRSYAKTDVTSNFLAIGCSRKTFLQLSKTLGARLGIGYRPGMASASAIGRLRGAAASHLGVLCQGGCWPSPY